MSSQQRTNEAAAIAPYLTHVVSHHGQLTLIPPDNAGRVRKPKPKKRPRPERSHPRSDDEMRFNTGPPRSLRSQASSIRGRRQRTTRSERSEGYEEDISIPDYPPPSFQEAISTPPPSTAANSTVALVEPTSAPSANSSRHLSPLSLPPSSPPNHPSPSPSEPSSTMPTAPSSPTDSESDKSIDIIDRRELTPAQIKWEEDRQLGLTLEQRVEREAQRKSAAERARFSSSTTATATADPLVLDTTLSEIHASRTGQRGVLSESDADDDDNATIAPSPRRRRTLSPLKALAAARHPLDHLVAVSSSASASSTYSLPLVRANPFFRSTTSLARPSGSSTGSSSPRSESFVPRRLLGKGKEKEKERAAGDSEPLNEWEVVDHSASTPSDEPVSPRRQGSPTPTPFTAKPSLPELSTLASAPRPVPSYTSMRDRKVPSPPDAFLNRHVRRPPPPLPPLRGPLSSPTSPTPSSPLAQTPASSNFSQFEKRSAPPPVPPKRPRVNPTPPAPPIPPKATRSPHEIPLPATPLDPAPFLELSAGPPSSSDDNNHWEMRMIPSPTWVVSDTDSASNHPQLSEQTRSPNRLTAPRTLHMPPAPTSLSRPSLSSPPASPSSTIRPGRHYPGRALPRPPLGPRPNPSGSSSLPCSPVDSFIETRFEWPSVSPPRECPVGDLIDLRNSQEIAADSSSDVWEQSGSPSTGRTTDMSEDESPPPSPAPTMTSFSSSASSVTLAPESQGSSATSTGAFSEYTDLDMLLARLNDNQSGGDYDTLLALSDFIGPATTPALASAISATHSGKVSLERRRVTKDGRVKLKLSLLGVVVDKCGICLSQFKEADMAALGSSCRHAFHEKCLRKWLAVSGTCPLCRVQLDVAEVS